MQVILTLSILGFTTLILLSFLTCRICFFEEYVIFTLGKLKILKLRGRSYAYLIYLILKHTGKKQTKKYQKKRKKQQKPFFRFGTNICIFVKRYERIDSMLSAYFINLINQLYPYAFKYKSLKFKIVNNDEFGISLAIRLLI